MMVKRRRICWFGLLLACAGCGVAEQPESMRTVAAYEVPLPTEDDREGFLRLLRQEASRAGYHVDSASAEELRHASDLVRMSMNATVWRGENDEESVASVMDLASFGRPWITFAKGEDPRRGDRFRDSLMRRVRQRWTETRSLPIMPSGSIPHPHDLVLVGDAYRLRRQAAANYQISSDSPLVAKN